MVSRRPHGRDLSAPLREAPSSPSRKREHDGQVALLHHLQRTAGNRAVAASLGAPDGPSVQRLLPTAELFDEVDLRTGAASVVGRSTFGAICTAITLYESAERFGKKMAQLDRAEELALRWLREHQRTVGDRDARRRKALLSLLEQLPHERKEISRKQAEEIYLDDVGAGSGKGDPAGQHRLEALSDNGRAAASGLKAGGGAAAERARAKGLTPAEMAAIRIYTAADYSYINPATAGNDGWLKSEKSKNAKLGGLSDQTIKEEGALHTGVALGGMKKLDEWTQDAFRGVRFTPAEFAQQLGGGTVSFSSFTSASTKQEIAFEFAHGIGVGPIDPSKSIAVVYVLRSAGARDLSYLSATPREAEVMVLPGSRFALRLNEVRGSQFDAYVERAKAMQQPLPKRWYIALLEPVKGKAGG